MSYKRIDKREKMMLERDAFMLGIGMAIAMVLVALTLNVPDKVYDEFDKQCYEICKPMVKEDIERKDYKFLTTTRYIAEINKCMDSCKEAKNENSSKSLGP